MDAIWMRLMRIGLPDNHGAIAMTPSISTARIVMDSAIMIGAMSRESFTGTFGVD